MSTKKSNQSNQSNNINRKNIVENSKLCNELIQQYASNHSEKDTEKYKNREIGKNGLPIGEKFTLTGEIKNANIDGYLYPVLVAADGREISVKNLMNISSLKGYITDNNIVSISEYYLEDNPETKLTKEYKADLIKNFDFKSVYQPPTRNFLTFVAMLENGEIPIKDRTLVYFGTVIKKFTAKTNNSFNSENWKSGYSRVIETQLWGFE